MQCSRRHGALWPGSMCVPFACAESITNLLIFARPQAEVGHRRRSSELDFTRTGSLTLVVNVLYLFSWLPMTKIAASFTLWGYSNSCGRRIRLCGAPLRTHTFA